MVGCHFLIIVFRQSRRRLTSGIIGHLKGLIKWGRDVKTSLIILSKALEVLLFLSWGKGGEAAVEETISAAIDSRQRIECGLWLMKEWRGV